MLLKLLIVYKGILIFLCDCIMCLKLINKLLFVKVRSVFVNMSGNIGYFNFFFLNINFFCLIFDIFNGMIWFKICFILYMF